MNQIWGGVRPRRSQAAKMLGHNGLTILLPVLFFAVSIAFWRSLATDAALTVANQIEYEDAALCTRFGFAAGTKVHDGCKLDLLDLRHRHEDLVTATAVP